jgi:DNA-binding NarL/FixJ family response regulator
MSNINRFLKEPRETLALKLATIEEVLMEPFAGHDLTPRQSEIAYLLARGFTTSEIAKNLDIANSTVKTTIGRIGKKIKLRPREFPRAMARSIEAVLETRLSRPIIEIVKSPRPEEW